MKATFFKEILRKPKDKNSGLRIINTDLKLTLTWKKNQSP